MERQDWNLVKVIYKASIYPPEMNCWGQTSLLVLYRQTGEGKREKGWGKEWREKGREERTGQAGGKERREKKKKEEQRKGGEERRSKSGRRRRIMVKTEKKGKSPRIVKSSQKAKMSAPRKREILVICEMGGWKSPLNMHDVMYCTFTTHTRPHSIYWPWGQSTRLICFLPALASQEKEKSVLGEV